MIPPTKASSSSVWFKQPVLAVWVVLAALTVSLCWRLWPEWSQNPDLSHGFFAPVVFLLLIAESRRHGTQRWLRESRWTGRIILSVTGGGFLLFALAGLLAASVAWTHALVLFILSASFGCFLLGGLLIFADEKVRVLPFNWISLTAIFLWVLVAPIPNGTYARLTLGLQNNVTDAVFSVLHFLGIAARQHGNMIELATTTVGVEEACSGIRSLISCVYAGFFFAAWQLRKPSHRLVLILTAPLLALSMNFIRSLLLTLLANAGKDITGLWHDVTGYSILGLTAAFLAWLAVILETKKENPPLPVVTSIGTESPRGALGIFWSMIVATLALGCFYFSASRPAIHNGHSVPALSAMLPAKSEGWQSLPSTNLYQFSSVLQTTHLMEQSYSRVLANGKFIRLSVYVAYWPAGQTTVSRVASHTPDACWPGSGWTPRPNDERLQTLDVSGRQLSPAEHRVFQNGDFAQHVWFWHIYNGRPIDYRDPYSVSALLELALQYGFRRQGDQSFIRISSNVPWSEIASEPLVQEIVSNLTKLGL